MHAGLIPFHSIPFPFHPKPHPLSHLLPLFSLSPDLSPFSGESAVGARSWRVLFAAISLPLATAAVVYFINHRYDGAAMWNLRGTPGVHGLFWLMNYASFFLLYPSTFNLLEVAAVDEPKLHLWETGVACITRHPQAVGQGLWCAAHTAWIGSSFMLATSAALMAHHLFSVWHGDYRLRRKYGPAFDALAERTSAFPFQAIWEGRQTLPPDYWREWARAPYLTIGVVTLGAYLAHPWMQSGAHWLGW
jgi:zeta-carotene isomerase